MSLSIEEFRKRLTDSGIMSRAEIDAFRESQAGGIEDATPNALAQALIEADRLTAFQADALLSENAQPVKLGNYRLVDVIGQGGMGQVYKALHERMNREVAIKVLPPLAAMDKGLVARFHREVQVAAKLHHPHIVTAYDADEANGLHFLVMEYMPGRDLARVVEEEGPLPVDRALDYILQAARALAYAHGEGILHRDVKPANLLVDDAGHVKVLDMGLARLEASDGLTVSGEVLGTAATMAPEQSDDVHAVDERTDVYGLGCTLFYLMGGRHMYEGDSALQVLVAHASKPIPKLRDVCPEASPDVEQFFEGLVQKDKTHRYPGMQAVIDAVEALLGGHAPQAPPVRPRSRPSRRTLLAWSGGLLLAAGLAWGAIQLPGSGSGATAHDLPSVLLSKEGTINALVLSPDGTTAYAGCVDHADGTGAIEVWDLTTGTRTHVLEGHEQDVRSIALTGDGLTLISSSNDTTIRVWDLQAHAQLRVLRGHTDKVRQIALAPDESWLASVSKDGSLRVWDWRTGTELRQQPGLADPSSENRGLLSVSIHPNATRIATTGYDRTVRIWNAESLETEGVIGPHQNDVGIVVFSPDGKHLLYDTDNGLVRVRTADGREELAVLRGHREWVYAITVSGDGSLAATGSMDTTVRVWQLPSGDPLHLFEGHRNTVNALAFTPDGARLLSGSADDTIRIHDLR
jgi:WD40 repeat protein/tRNA A-37 threonylcarbamoyl transferase component Bud32